MEQVQGVGYGNRVGLLLAKSLEDGLDQTVQQAADELSNLLRDQGIDAMVRKRAGFVEINPTTEEARAAIHALSKKTRGFTPIEYGQYSFNDTYVCLV